MKRLILHAGTHKTGTTAIQSIAAQNRDALYAQGLYYPKSWSFFGNDPRLQSANAHFSLCTALARGAPNDLKRLDRFKQHLSHEIPEAMTILISAESMSRHVLGADSDFDSARDRFVARMATYFDGFQVEVCMYFRSPGDYAESLFSESLVSSQNRREFDTATRNYVDRFRYRFQQDTFARYFPTSCYSFEAKKADLAVNFFRTLNLPLPTDTTLLARRPSIPKAAVLWMLKAKRDKEEIMDRPERLTRWLFALQQENADIFRSNERSSFWRDQETRDQFNQRMLDGFDAVAFDPSDPPAAPCEWSLSSHEAAESRFREWLDVHADRLANRAERRVAPFIDTQLTQAVQ